MTATGAARRAAARSSARVVAGILAGEAAGPGAAVARSCVGVVGVLVAALLATSPDGSRRRSRCSRSRCSARAVMQRALARARRLAARARDRAPRRRRASRGTLVDDPDGGRVRRARARPRRRRFDGRGGGATAARRWSTASGDVAGHGCALLAAGDGVTLRGWLEPLDGLRRRAGGGSTRSARSTPPSCSASRRPASPLDRLANAARGAGARAAPSTSRRPTARCSPASSSATPAACPTTLTEQFRAAGLTHLSRCRARTSRSCWRCSRRCSAGSALRGRRRRRRSRCSCCFGTMTRWEPSVLRAIAMAVDRAASPGYLGRPTRGRARARARGDRAAARRPVPAALGRLPAVVRREPRASRVLARPIAARLRGPAWMREVLGVTAAAQVGVAPGAAPGVRLDAAGRAPGQPGRGAARRAAHDVGSRRRRRRRPGPAAVAPRSPRLLAAADGRAARTRCIAVADLASRVPVAVDGRAAWGRGRARLPLAARAAPRTVVGSDEHARLAGTASVTTSTTSPTRTLVMGILNRTPDSFYDHGRDVRARRAARSAPRSWSTDGADLLDVGGVKAGPGPEVGEAEELDRVVPPIEALHERFDVAISCDTWRAVGARRGVRGRRGRRQRHQRLRRSRLPRASRPSTTRRSSRPTSGCSPACPTPNRTTTTSSATSPRSCSTAPRARRGRRARARADRARRRPRPRQDAGAERGAAARERRARRARLHAAAVGVEQAVPRRAARARDRRPARARRSRRSRTASRTAAGSCGCTTSPGRSQVCRMIEAILGAVSG